MDDAPADGFSTLRITAEENILYLLGELDRALERATPVWMPHQAKVAKRLVTRLIDKLRTIAVKL